MCLPCHVSQPVHTRTFDDPNSASAPSPSPKHRRCCRKQSTPAGFLSAREPAMIASVTHPPSLQTVSRPADVHREPPLTACFGLGSPTSPSTGPMGVRSPGKSYEGLPSHRVTRCRSTAGGHWVSSCARCQDAEPGNRLTRSWDRGAYYLPVSKVRTTLYGSSKVLYTVLFRTPERVVMWIVTDEESS